MAQPAKNCVFRENLDNTKHLLTSRTSGCKHPHNLLNISNTARPTLTTIKPTCPLRKPRSLVSQWTPCVHGSLDTGTTWFTTCVFGETCQTGQLLQLCNTTSNNPQHSLRKTWIRSSRPSHMQLHSRMSPPRAQPISVAHFPVCLVSSNELEATYVP